LSRSVALAGALLALLLAPAARASFTVTPASTRAGAHTDVAIHADFASTTDSTVLDFAPGLVGNPSAAAKCPVATFENGMCPPNTQVGTASATSRTLGPSASGGVFNLVPHPDEPARLGIRLDGGLPPVLPLITVRNEAAVTVRPDGSLDSTIAALDDGGLGVQSLDLTLSSSFMRLPTSCARATTALEAPPNPPQSASFTPTNCAAVPFHPAAAIHLETTRPRGAERRHGDAQPPERQLGRPPRPGRPSHRNDALTGSRERPAGLLERPVRLGARLPGRLADRLRGIRHAAARHAP
jgi:hypothetical protein